jgi:hypothetical protein
MRIDKEIKYKDKDHSILVLLGNIIVSELGKKFPAFCGTRRFITMFIKASNWTLS